MSRNSFSSNEDSLGDVFVPLKKVTSRKPYAKYESNGSVKNKSTSNDISNFCIKRSKFAHKYNSENMDSQKSNLENTDSQKSAKRECNSLKGDEKGDNLRDRETNKNLRDDGCEISKIFDLANGSNNIQRDVAGDSINQNSNSSDAINDKLPLKQCPVCLREVKRSAFVSHVKSCSMKNNLNTRQVLQALELQEKLNSERIALGLPDFNSVAVNSGPTKKNYKSKNNTKDTNLQLAIALSASLNDAKEMEIMETAECLSVAGLEQEAAEHRAHLENYGFVSSISEKKSKTCATRKNPVLFTRTREDRERMIMDKVASVLMEENGDNDGALEKIASTVRRRVTYLANFHNQESTCWKLCAGNSENLEAFYSANLEKFIDKREEIDPSTKLHRLSQIPGRWTTPTKCEAEVNNSVRDWHLRSPEEIDRVKADDSPLAYSTLRKGPKNPIPLSSETLKDGDRDSNCVKCVKLEKFSCDWKFMLNNEFASDVVIYVKMEQAIYAHKLVFHTRCPSILKDIATETENGVSKEVILWMEYSYESALTFLEYLYAGILNSRTLKREDLKNVCELAARYDCNDIACDLNVDNEIFTEEEFDLTVKVNSPWKPPGNCRLKRKTTSPVQNAPEKKARSKSYTPIPTSPEVTRESNLKAEQRIQDENETSKLAKRRIIYKSDANEISDSDSDKTIIDESNEATSTRHEKNRNQISDRESGVKRSRDKDRINELVERAISDKIDSNELSDSDSDKTIIIEMCDTNQPINEVNIDRFSNELNLNRRNRNLAKSYDFENNDPSCALGYDSDATIVDNLETENHDPFSSLTELEKSHRKLEKKNFCHVIGKKNSVSELEEGKSRIEMKKINDILSIQKENAATTFGKIKSGLKFANSKSPDSVRNKDVTKNILSCENINGDSTAIFCTSPYPTYSRNITYRNGVNSADDDYYKINDNSKEKDSEKDLCFDDKDNIDFECTNILLEECMKTYNASPILHGGFEKMRRNKIGLKLDLENVNLSSNNSKFESADSLTRSSHSRNTSRSNSEDFLAGYPLDEVNRSSRLRRCYSPDDDECDVIDYERNVNERKPNVNECEGYKSDNRFDISYNNNQLADDNFENYDNMPLSPELFGSAVLCGGYDGPETDLSFKRDVSKNDRDRIDFKSDVVSLGNKVEINTSKSGEEFTSEKENDINYYDNNSFLRDDFSSFRKISPSPNSKKKSKSVDDNALLKLKKRSNFSENVENDLKEDDNWNDSPLAKKRASFSKYSRRRTLERDLFSDSLSLDENVIAALDGEVLGGCEKMNYESGRPSTSTPNTRKFEKKSKSFDVSCEKNCVTPLADYSLMETPLLKKELDKYGLKCGLSRNKAKTMLRYIYDQLHPYVSSSDEEDVSNKYISSEPGVFKPGSSQTGSRKPGSINTHLRKAASSQPASSKRGSSTKPDSSRNDKEKNELQFTKKFQKVEGGDSDSDSSISGRLSAESGIENLEYDCIPEDADVGMCTQQIKISIHEGMRSLLSDDRNLHQSILFYEPVLLESLKERLKSYGVKCSINKLLDYLDEKCITFRSLNQRGPKKKRKKIADQNI